MRAALPTWDEYAEAWSSLHGGIDPRQARTSVRSWLRFGYALAKLCARLRVRPGAVTAIGLLACVLTPIFAARGSAWAVLAALLVLVSATADTVDGALAVITSHTTRLGYVYDAVVDRIGEACWLLALWLLGVPAYVVVAACALSWLHEYARSRANAAGMAEIGAATVGERPTRVALAVLGIGMAGVVGVTSNALPAGIATFAAAVWIVLAIIGFAQLFATVHNTLAGQAWPGRPRTRRRNVYGDVVRPNNIGLDPRYVNASRMPSAVDPKPVGVPASASDAAVERDADPDSAASASSVLAPPDAARGPGAGPPGHVIDEELLREISKLGSLPGASSVYTSGSTGKGHRARRDQRESGSGRPEGDRRPS